MIGDQKRNPRLALRVEWCKACVAFRLLAQAATAREGAMLDWDSCPRGSTPGG